MKNLLLTLLLPGLMLLSLNLAAQDFDDLPGATLSPLESFRDVAYNYVQYPAIARKAGQGGLVRVKYSVKPSGEITNVQAEFLQPGTEIDDSIDQIVVIGQRQADTDVSLQERAILTLQAESLMVLQRIRQLQPRTIDGQRVLTSREVVFKFILE